MLLRMCSAGVPHSLSLLHGWFITVALIGCAGAEATALVAPSTPPTAALENNGVGLTPGETMAFEIRLGAMVAGEVQLAVGEPGNFQGRRAVVVTSTAETKGAVRLLRPMVDQATTTIDLTSGRPLALETQVMSGDKTTIAQATFSDATATVTYRRDTDPKPQTFRVEFGTQAVHDTHSAMAQVRSWKATPGQSRSVYVVSGRKLWRVDVRMIGNETIGSSMGNRSASHFSGAAFRARPNLSLESAKPSRTFEVWVSDDADRVPLKVTATTELGDVAMALTDYNRP